jgi:hypothetical protein
MSYKTDEEEEEEKEFVYFDMYPFDEARFDFKMKTAVRSSIFRRLSSDCRL